ncbi:AEC family transporter [Agromyces intestinalis]|uniref:AEC family transporter n=1 Tax=Agromyces intestinalis TaxID=2592652 RepID=A0A5C1YHG5_9MICO|nr:AEC family transporter [Agromyces intestinalis]QEO15015.1 AEC family transporter [Agromyces intestinalis]
MSGIVTGFAVIGLAVFVGWVAARTGVVGPEARPVLAKLNFTVLAPFLLFSVLSTADVRELFSTLLPVYVIASVGMMALAAVFALALRRSLPEATVGSLAAGYVNGNNIGIPVALYMLGDAALSAPVVLLQLLVFMPVALAVLGATVDGRTSVAGIVRGTLGNPIIIGSILGVGVAVSGLRLPEWVSEPVSFVGHATVPLMLIAYGLSLHGQRVLAPGRHRIDVIVLSTLKLVAMPLAAWALARFAFGLDDDQVYAVTVLASLPTAQNVHVIAQRYSTGELVARDTIFVTTLGAVPLLIVVGVLLGT